MGRQPANQVHPRLRRRNIQQSRKFPPRGGDQRRLAFLVERAHAADVPRKMPVGQELGHQRLLQARTVPVGEGAGGDEGIHHRVGRHEVAEPEPGVEHLGAGDTRLALEAFRIACFLVLALARGDFRFAMGQ